ncbi:ATP binding microtubule motor family protein [Artemisia annua]|uniref:ATP binding microtubule motor family protein n=1 Tax=Artemisia annua TaxID=35608 RepID=A0A2U1NNJ0_ARTAN|nr:ATP binding microtubule motor family protein [Artemisia annua]
MDESRNGSNYLNDIVANKKRGKKFYLHTNKPLLVVDIGTGTTSHGCETTNPSSSTSTRHGGQVYTPLFPFAQRKVGETSLNETSSRSHQILRLTIESSARLGETSTKRIGQIGKELRTPAPTDYSALFKKKDQQIEKLEKKVQDLIKQRDLAESQIKELLLAVRNEQTSTHVQQSKILKKINFNTNPNPKSTPLVSVTTLEIKEHKKWK